jgi:hypothetical protein
MKKLPRLLQQYAAQKKYVFWGRGGMFWFEKCSNIFYQKLQGDT